MKRDKVRPAKMN